MTRLLGGFLSVLLLAGCGGGEEITLFEDNVVEEAAAPLPLEPYEPSMGDPLSGEWSVCFPIWKGGKFKLFRTVKHDGRFRDVERVYLDKECKTPDWGVQEVIWEGTYKLVARQPLKTRGEIFHIDYVFEIKVEGDGPDKGKVKNYNYYDIFRVEDDLAFFGMKSQTLDGTSPERRPEKIDEDRYWWRVDVATSASEKETEPDS